MISFLQSVAVFWPSVAIKSVLPESERINTYLRDLVNADLMKRLKRLIYILQFVRLFLTSSSEWLAVRMTGMCRKPVPVVRLLDSCVNTDLAH